MKRSLIQPIRYLLARGAEAATSVALVLLFFLSLMALLNWVFPIGPGLSTLLAAGRTGGSFASPGAGETGSGLRAEGVASSSAVATLEEIHNAVKAKPSDAIAWTNADTGMPLENRHSVQTFRNASALITFDESSEISVGQNTVVVIQRKDSDLFSRGPRSYALTVDGELRGRMIQGDAQAVEFEVTTPAGTALVKPHADEPGEVEFRVSVAEDNTAQITVDKGVAEISVGRDTVTVRPEQYTQMVAEELPRRPQRLSPAPRLVTPAAGSVFLYRSVPPPVEFKWTASLQADRYRVQISRDRAFDTVLYDDVTTRSTYTHHSLSGGVYFWRVTGYRGSAAVTVPLRGSFRIRQDRNAPVLEVIFPPEVVKSESCVISGRAEPGTRVVLNGRDLTLSDRGTFEYTLALAPGLNVVVVEAIDTAGNTAYESQMINRKF